MVKSELCREIKLTLLHPEPDFPLQISPLRINGFIARPLLYYLVPHLNSVFSLFEIEDALKGETSDVSRITDQVNAQLKGTQLDNIAEIQVECRSKGGKMDHTVTQLIPLGI